MFKSILLFIILVIKLGANEIVFEESKYISAIDTSTKKSGLIHLKKEFISLSYANDIKKYFFYENKIVLIEEEKKEILSYEDNIELEIFYKLIRAIYSNNFELLNEYFKITHNKKNIHLEANNYISDIILTIEIKKDKDFLTYLNISFTNEDRIKIVQTK